MAATVQTIVKPTRARGLDTSGNKNHAQLYSGRALEFDGVTDYLTTGYDWADDSITVCVWAKHFEDSGSKTIFDTRQANDSGMALRFSTTEKLDFFIDTSDINYNDYTFTNRWVRICAVYDKLNQKQTLYINGVKVAEKTSVDMSAIPDSATTNGCTIGARSITAHQNYYNGYLSDLQAWNVPFSADDALYDYLNPEQLALNRGGTSLTNSNLKLWYPMNEGHRGNQSYVLDASNTGVGDDIVNWSSTFNASGTSTDDFGSWTTNANDSTTFCTFDHDNKTIRLRTTDGTHVQAFYTPDIMRQDVMYKFEYTISKIKTGNVRVRPQGNTDYTNHTEVGTYSYITTPASSSYLVFRIERGLTSGANDFTVSDVKVYPINNKYNATTVFYGDELNTTTNNRTFAGSGDWAAYNGTTVDVNSTVAGKMHITFEGDGTSQGAQLTIGNMGGTIVAGRKYRIEADLDYISGADTDIKIKFCIGGTNDATCVVSATDGSPSDGGITTTEETYYSEVVAANSTGALLILAKSAENDNASDPALITVDNVSVKEIGIASGWTDADQQLDIPQTALQSYNQLTFFDGKDNYYQTSSDITPGDHTSVSFWVFINQGGADDSYGLLRAGTYGDQNFRILGQTDKIDIVTYNEDESTVTETHSFATTVELGQWHHIAAYIPRQSGNSAILYFNGQKLTTDAMARDMKVEAHNWRLGLGYGITYQYLQGAMTEFSYFNVKLTDDEFLELYNNGKVLNALDHSQAGNLVHYWRNEGLGNWNDLKGSNNLTAAGSPTETMLITAGVDSSRDSQGFFMNRQRTTNSLNNNTIIDGDIDRGAYSKVETHPLYTGSVVTNYSISFWMKIGIKPSDFLSSGNSFSLFDTTISNSIRAFRASLNHNNILYMYTYYGTSAGNESVYCDYDLDSLGGSIVNPPTASNNGIGEAFDPNKWYHVTWTFDHDRTTGSGNADNTNAEDHNFTPYFVYINGIQVAAEGREGANSAMTTARSMLNSNVPMIIGSDMATGGNPSETSYQDFPGEIDDVCFYSDTLTDEEVLRNYNAGKRSHK